MQSTFILLFIQTLFINALGETLGLEQYKNPAKLPALMEFVFWRGVRQQSNK